MKELKVESVFCSGRLPRLEGPGLIELWGRLKDVAKGLLDPVGVGCSDCCWLFVAHGLLLPGCIGASCCAGGDCTWNCGCCCCT